jgi:cytoskeletal protein CcmA (bactofilin family)
VTKRGKIVGEVGELTVFNPADGYSTGIFEDGVSDPKAASAKYFIAGQIQATKNGETTVRVGGQSFKFKLTQDAKLKIEVSDYSIAKPDDEISITGSGLRKDQIEAREIEIKLGMPLAGVEEKTRRRASAKKPASKPQQPQAGEVEDPAAL